MRILVTGGTGFVGRHLLDHLERAGHSVSLVSRRPNVGVGWEEDSLARAVEAHEAIVHLAGAGIFDRRWSAAYRDEIRASRVDTTRRVAELCARVGDRRLVSTSAVGYYGPQARDGDEGSPPGEDFLAGVCRDWEAALEPARAAGIPTAVVRTGVALGADGGALKRMLLPFRLGLGGPLGSGRQPFPWIHVDDLCRLYAHLVTRRDGGEAFDGPFNAVAPGLCDQRSFARTLGRVLGRPAFLPAPAPALRLALGGVAEVLLEGQGVAPRRTLATGFTFGHPNLEPALRELVERARTRRRPRTDRGV